MHSKHPPLWVEHALQLRLERRRAVRRRPFSRASQFELVTPARRGFRRSCRTASQRVHPILSSARQPLIRSLLRRPGPEAWTQYTFESSSSINLPGAASRPARLL